MIFKRIKPSITLTKQKKLVMFKNHTEHDINKITKLAIFKRTNLNMISTNKQN